MLRASSLLIGLLGPALCLAQYSASNVTLYKQFTLADLQTTGASSCWGYTSPTGREYAIMGCNNKVAFVEITDPANPVYFANVPHITNIWTDIKTYKNACYVSTEQTGNGIQVIDLSDIDNHNVTLVRTLTNPGRAHTIHVDNDSGFLYCCGTRESSGTTMCFDVSDPLNPVRVGQNSLTGSLYQHETIVHTYASGPYAGRQIMFSGGVDRGVEIWDVTDKDHVTLVRRIAYPFVGYCHQGWLSDDMKYFYVNDELDEKNYGNVTRTLVFDISVLETTDLVGTFSTNLPSTDHNLYWKNNFIFEGNYTSGLRVFDAYNDPIQPVERGFFDTYPHNDSAGFHGLWSNYPFFPSGTVIGGDINRGLFIWDVSEATRTTLNADEMVVERGNVISGGLRDLGRIDDSVLVMKKGITVNPNEAPIRIVMDGTCAWQDISKLRFELRNRVDSAGLVQTVEFWDFLAQDWVAAGSATPGLIDTTFTFTAPRPDRFVEQGTKHLRARIQIKPAGPTTVADWRTVIDLGTWVLNP